MQPVVPRLAPHPQQVHMPAAPHAATPLLAASVSISPGDGGAATWRQMRRTMREAAWRFGATCALGTGAAFAVARYYNDRQALFVGLPLTAVTALGVTSWRLTRDPAPRDLEQGGPILLPRSPAALAGPAGGPAGGDLVWIAAPADTFTRAYGATRSKAVETVASVKSPRRARARHVARSGAARLRPQMLEQQQLKLRADARKRSSTARPFGRVGETSAPPPVAAQTSTPRVSTPTSAPSEPTLLGTSTQLTPKAPEHIASLLSQSLPSPRYAPWTSAHGQMTKLAQSAADHSSARRPHPPDGASQPTQPQALAQALENLTRSGPMTWMRDADDDGLIMPAPRQDQPIRSESERSSLSELLGVSCRATPISSRTPLTQSPTSD